jgi:hypothetical protein
MKSHELRIVREWTRCEWRGSILKPSTFPNRRDLLAALAVAGALSLLPVGLAKAAEDDAIRPFQIDVSDEALADLRAPVHPTVSELIPTVLGDLKPGN